jgi:hypothetical protein
MPAAIGDPGVFVCSNIGEPAPVREPANAGVDFAHVRAPRRRHWLVLELCPSCNSAVGVYCKAHRSDNWWLENYRVGGHRKGAPSTDQLRSGAMSA